MRTTIKEMFLLMAAVSATFGHAGDSAPILLDLVDGTRIATEGVTIPIAYSPRWGNAASCTVAETRKAALVSSATDEGTVSWTPQGVGGHTLTHTAGDLTYTAQFMVLGDDVAVHAGTLGTSETWGTDKVHLVTAAVTVPSGVSLTIQAGAVVKFMPGASLTVAGGGSCTARGVVFTHVNDDTIGGDTLMDGDSAVAKMGDYAITGSIIDDDSTEYRYMPPQTLQSSISSNTHLRGYRTYIVSNSVTVASGATLTLQSGTVLKFNTGCSLTVNGILDAQGTRAAPIVFTSLKDDIHGGDANGDEDKTYPYAGDWYQIRVAGTANFNYCHVLYNSSTENYGAVEAYGGTVNFDNSEIAHTKYECVNAHSSGNFTARNSIFRDSSLGFGYYGSGRVKAYNCVFADLSVAVRQSGKTLTNCAFYRCFAFTDQSGDGSTYSHCLFFNPSGYGAQSYSKCGSNGNIWGDPLFDDPDSDEISGLFIAANSPCINAGDGTIAPETDYYGQPRDGVPDIGIYEVQGDAGTGYDIAAAAVNAQAARSTIGDTIEVSYDVANVGRLAVTDPWHDALYLVSSASGKQYALGEPLNPGGLGAGETRTYTSQFALPVVPVGQYRLRLAVNSRRMDVPEGAATENNAIVSEGEIEVVADNVDAADGANGSVAAGASSVCAFTLPSGSGDRLMRVTSSAGGATLSARCGLGFLPVNADAGTALSFSGGAAWISVPAGTEKVWLVLDNGGTAAASYAVEFIDGSLTLSGIFPASIPSSGNVTVEIAGAGFTDECEVSFTGAGTVAPLSVKRVSQGLLAATVDAAAFVSGKTYSVAVKKGTETKTLQDALSVAAAPGKPKFWAKLDVPSSMRQGRLVETCFIEYGNSGTADMLSPVLQVSMTGDGTLGYIGGLSGLKTLQFVAAGEKGSAGVLRPGSSHRIRFAIRAGASNKISLHTSEGSDYAPAPWTNAADYLADLSAAATRVGYIYGDAADFTMVCEFATRIATNESFSTVSGVLMDENGVFLPNIGITLSNSDAVYVTQSDYAGRFVFDRVQPGRYSTKIADAFDADSCDVEVDNGGDYCGLRLVVCARQSCDIVGNGFEEDCTIVLTHVSSGTTIVSQFDKGGKCRFERLSSGLYRVVVFDATRKLCEQMFVCNNEHFENRLELSPQQFFSVSGWIEGWEQEKYCVVRLSGTGLELTKKVDGEGRFTYEDLPEGYYSIGMFYGDEDGVEYEDGPVLFLDADISTNICLRTRIQKTGQQSTTRVRDANLVRLSSGNAGSLWNRVVEALSEIGDWFNPSNAYHIFEDYFWECWNVMIRYDMPNPPIGDYDCPHNREKYVRDLRTRQEYEKSMREFQSNLITVDGWKFVADGFWLIHKYNNLLWDAFWAKWSKGKADALQRAALDLINSIATTCLNDFAAQQRILSDDELSDLDAAMSLLSGTCDDVDKVVAATKIVKYSIDKLNNKSYYSHLGDYSKFGKVFDFASKVVTIGNDLYETWKACEKFWEEKQRGDNAMDNMRDLAYRVAVWRGTYQAKAPHFNEYPLCCTQCFPEAPYDPPVATTTPNVPKSCDPNEMVGEEGVGAARYVKPGQELTYTIYFENKAGFDIADAQEVKVTNPLSEWLDWSTFEMLEVAFNNQCDVNLDGLANGTSEVQMNGTNKYVRTTVECDAGNGVVTWYMRVYDPHGDSEGYPLDGSGFLPSNDATHCGEGHITYRIKVRDDAPRNVVITNSASIVFDINDPIETDPAWWNTVGIIHTEALDLGGGVSSNLTLIAGEPFGVLPTPSETRTGYTFDAWYTGPNGTGTKATPTAIVPTGRFSLYASWVPNRYSIVYVLNGGTNARGNPATYTIEDAVSLAAPTRDGYTFTGWTPNGGQIAKGSTGDKTFTAQWAFITMNYGGVVENVTFSKARTVIGALYDAKGDLAGTVELKFGKINKKQVVKVSGSATLMVDGKAKKVTAKAANLTLSGGGLAGTIAFKAPVGDMAFAMDADGAFTLKSAKYEMVGMRTRASAAIPVAVGGVMPNGTLHFNVDMDSMPSFGKDGALLEAALPADEPVKVSGGKWSFGKAATLKYKKNKATGAYELIGLDDAAKPNVSGLKLTYTAKTGIFKGSFKLYATNEATTPTGKAPKLKKFTVNVIGFVVDGVGYGEATLKKPAASWTVTVE